MKDVTCPQCKRGMTTTGNFYHDVDMNLICRNCDVVIFGTTRAAEARARVSAGRLQGTATFRKECIPIKLPTDRTGL